MIRHRATADVPFASAEDAWMWTCRMVAGSVCGLPVHRGAAAVGRPCQPIDVVHVVDRLYRQRQLTREHLAVLRHYGRRQSAPVPARDREFHASCLWAESFALIGPALAERGFIRAAETAETAPV